jgi:hypothetical protein
MITNPEYLHAAFLLFVVLLIMLAVVVDWFWDYPQRHRPILRSSLRDRLRWWRRS